MTDIELLPLGDLGAGRARIIAARLSRRVGAPCRVGEPVTAGPSRPLPGRDQTDADALLAWLESQPVRDCVVLGVTAADLAIPIFTFVFGRARSGGRAAVVSLARLDPAFYGLPPDEDALIARAVREALHELGHVAALAHCESPECLMRFAGSVEKADLRGGAFCPACAPRLPDWLRPPGAAHPGEDDSGRPDRRP